KSVENLLIAHNRLPRSGDDDFTMNGYVVQANERGKGKAAVAIDGVRFDYDNRPGIYANHFAVGGPGGVGPNGTPETHPEGFRKGTVMHGNYVFSTGRCAIGFSGDGTVATGNVIRFAKDAWRPTATGRDRTSGSSTNDTRAMEIRGWRWDVSDNDYEVHRNWAYDRKYPINDGEGLMHEDHCNSSIRDSVMRGNRGNAYLSLYKTAGIDGLLIEGNDIRPPGGASSIAPIFVSANRTREPFPIRNVTIRGNTTNGAILIEGKPGENNLVEGNQFVGQGEGVIQNRASATVRDNRGFKEANQPE
nr:hypothetical protein [Akkermansiaceae bacterium]